MPIDSSVGHHEKLQSYTRSIVTWFFFVPFGWKKSPKLKNNLKKRFPGAPSTNTDEKKIITEKDIVYVQMHILYTSVNLAAAAAAEPTARTCVCVCVCVCGGPDRKWWESAMSDGPLLLLLLSVNNGSAVVKRRRRALVFSNGQKTKKKSLNF